MRINNNLMAINTHRQLGITNTASSKSMEKLILWVTELTEPAMMQQVFPFQKK